MKLYLAASASQRDTFLTFRERPKWSDDFGRWWEGAAWNFSEEELRELGFTRKLPTGKQVLAVKLTIR